jgi:predicted RND superfamily exporter protein
VLEWVVTLLCLPAFLRVVLKEKSWVDKNKVVKFLPIGFINRISLPPIVCKMLLLIFFIAPFTFNHMNISDVPTNLFKVGNPFRESIQYLFETRSFKGDVSLVFNDLSQEAFNRSILKKLKLHPNVARIEDPYEIMDFYTKNLDHGDISLMKDSLKRTPQLKRFFSDHRARAIVYLKDVELGSIALMRKQVKEEFCPNRECALAGLLVAYADFSQSVSQTLISSFSLSFVLVILTITVLAYFTSNMRYLFQLLTSSMWGVAVTLTVLSCFQIKINFVTSVVISVLVGMNGDNTIQFILAGMDQGIERGIENRAEGSIITSILLIGASMTFLFHYFEPPTMFGYLLMFGFLTALVGDLFILKGLLPKQKP